jgi:hypothetical protein
MIRRAGGTHSDGLVVPIRTPAKGAKHMGYYYFLDSGGPYTNLQLFSLQRAADDWNKLADMIAKDEFEVDYPKERLVFILSSLGLSLSQLLGQNCPSPEKEKMDQPDVLFRKLLKRASIDRTKRQRLEKAFGQFLIFYAAVRHFGGNKDNRHYRTIDALTLSKLESVLSHGD